MMSMSLQQASTLAARLHPSMGVLCRDGRPVFYAFVAGTMHEHTSADEVASLLARPEFVKPARRAAPRREERDYIVTCTSTSPAYGERPGELEVRARDRNEAISKARARVRDSGWTRQDGAIIYTARRA